MRVTAVTLAEDPAHPESWLRDARLEYWDAAAEKWVFAQYLTSDAPIHSHKLAHPIEAAKFRLTRPDGAGWPASNLRLAEIVLHGERLGPSHPDVLRNSPVAVLFDESRSDLQCMVSGHNPQFEFRNGGAASGGLFMALKAEGRANASYTGSVFGHAVPNWDFEIVEHPTRPGQYRWLQFSCKSLAPATRGISLRLGGFVADIGAPAEIKEGVWTRRQLTEKPEPDWTLYRVDLWAEAADFRAKHPEARMTISGLTLFSVGGGAGFDRILLARSESDSN